MKKCFENKKKMIVLVALSLFCTLFIGCKSLDAKFFENNGRFIKIGNLNFPRWGHTAILMKDGNVLIVGGFSGERYSTKNYIANAEIYNPKKNKFIKAGKLNIERSDATSVLLQDGKVFITGGTFREEKKQKKIQIKSMEIYDPKKDKFEYIGDTPIYWDKSLLLNDGRVLLYSAYYTPVIGIFNSKDNSVKKVNTCLTKKHCPHTAVLLKNETVLFVGGSFPNNVPQIYNPKTNTIRFTNQVKFHKRMSSTATLLKNGEVIIIGGETLREGYVRNAEIYNPQTGTFRLSSELNQRRMLHSSILLPNGKVLVVGGETGLDEESKVLKSAELYNPKTDKFIKIHDMYYSSSKPILTLLNDGNVLILGTKPEIYVSK